MYYRKYLPEKINNKRGFTLVEIAIVLVIIGLLLGGILKGQELINNAKVRAIADRQNSLKVAWFSFIDRFAAIPGDYIQADVYITGASPGNGDGTIDSVESPLVLQHLTSSGYLRCAQCTETATDSEPNATNSMTNSYGGVISIWHDSGYYLVRSTAGRPDSSRLQIHTGPRIPSNVLAEVDRKIDDGTPNSGDLVFNDYDPQANTGNNLRVRIGQCVKRDKIGTSAGGWINVSIQYWRPANSSPPVWGNCGAAIFI